MLQAAANKERDLYFIAVLSLYIVLIITPAFIKALKSPCYLQYMSKKKEYYLNLLVR